MEHQKIALQMSEETEATPSAWLVAGAIPTAWVVPKRAEVFLPIQASQVFVRLQIEETFSSEVILVCFHLARTRAAGVEEDITGEEDPQRVAGAGARATPTFPSLKRPTAPTLVMERPSSALRKWPLALH